MQGNVSNSAGTSTPSELAREITDATHRHDNRDSKTIGEKLQHTWAVSLANTLESNKATANNSSEHATDKPSSKHSHPQSSV